MITVTNDSVLDTIEILSCEGKNPYKGSLYSRIQVFSVRVLTRIPKMVIIRIWFLFINQLFTYIKPYKYLLTRSYFSVFNDGLFVASTSSFYKTGFIRSAVSHL